MTPLTGIPSPPLDWASFEVGPLTVHLYALFIVAGMVLAVLWTDRRLTARGGEKWITVDFAIWAVLLGLLGARLYHVFTHPADYFFEGANFWRIFFIWEGGNAIIGSLIGGAIGIFIASRMTGIRMLAFSDALIPGLLLAQAVGRLGNYFNHELYGWPTDLPWGLQIEASNPAFPVGLPEGTLFHPTFLYEMLWNLAGIAIIVLLERMFRWRAGKTLASYLIWYGTGRIWIESIRVDYSEVILGMRSNVFGALCLVIVGIALFVVVSRLPVSQLSDSVYLPGRDPESEAAAKAAEEDELGEQESDEGDEDEADAEETSAQSEVHDEETSVAKPNSPDGEETPDERKEASDSSRV
ncbi:MULTISPECIES: prolipoprotein diacylglyceryl transferase [unclassified Pseudoclavibacter]|uniref:prolipoprotein diacylglyceryl transferase n=1 Tax=unclassified Pseudoclavibacter TaxID=2615177 RepID=UPI001BA72AAA|nr:prolipoprotein diacylglyceryl transferase [Pseudoclavibacter sp. Marseille-Q4354]MBS3177979.1 prolipoprotein diacylglyceryl transferase [Pseudoclavibacter sp. Marseille-Q4354]